MVPWSPQNAAEKKNYTKREIKQVFSSTLFVKVPSEFYIFYNPRNTQIASAACCRLPLLTLFPLCKIGLIPPNQHLYCHPSFINGFNISRKKSQQKKLKKQKNNVCVQQRLQIKWEKHHIGALSSIKLLKKQLFMVQSSFNLMCK